MIVFDSSGFSPEETLISASTVPHREVEENSDLELAHTGVDK